MEKEEEKEVKKKAEVDEEFAGAEVVRYLHVYT